MSLKRRDSALVKAREARERVRAAERDVADGVARALYWEATWVEIGDALGVSAQAAHRRFRHLRYDPASGRAL